MPDDNRSNELNRRTLFRPTLVAVAGRLAMQPRPQSMQSDPAPSGEVRSGADEGLPAEPGV